jgi:hypothetical protein
LMTNTTITSITGHGGWRSCTGCSYVTLSVRWYFARICESRRAVRVSFLATPFEWTLQRNILQCTDQGPHQ